MAKKKIDLHNIELPTLPLNVLASRAALYHNNHLPAPPKPGLRETLGNPQNDLPDDWKYTHPLRARESSEPLFLRQIEVQYLQRTLRSVREALEAQNHPEAEIEQAIMGAIELTYPHLLGVHLTSPVNEPNPPMLTLKAVKERGWTDALIRKYLPTPDALKDNPMYKRAAPMKLYRLSRVEAAETTPEFTAAFEKILEARPAARNAVQKAVETKRQQLLSYVQRLEIVVPVLARDDLLQQARWHYNDRNRERERFADGSSDPAFLRRITVNFVRHRLTEYEDELYRLFGRVGTADGYRALSIKVYTAIAEAYPYLADECRRQANDKGVGLSEQIGTAVPERAPSTPDQH